MELKFMDPGIDFAFKKIFGSEDTKEVLISFLESLLDLEGDKRIKHIAITDPYQLPAIKALKTSILDVKCTDHRNVTYVVEMQTSNATGFLKRIQYNASKAYVNQIVSGKDYPKLNQVIAITITRFTTFDDFNHYLSCHELKETKTNESYLDQTIYYFAELSKFNKKESELESNLDKWLFFIKEASELQAIPEKLNQEPFIKAFEKAKVINMDRDEFEFYDKAAMAVTDAEGAIEFAEEKGMKKGEAKGRKEGREEGREEGRREGQINLLLKQLELKFGPMSAELRNRIHAADSETLSMWSERILTAHTLDEVI